MSKRDAYQQKLEGKLHEWQADIDKLKARAEQASGDTKLDYEEQLSKLRKHRAEAAEKLDKLRDASDSAWEDIKTGAEDAWHSVEDAIADARRHFK